MGITYFIVFIACAMACLLILLLKNFADSILLGGKQDLAEPEELHEASIRTEIERRKAEAFIENYMLSLEQARCEKEQRMKREAREMNIPHRRPPQEHVTQYI